jgi:ATP-dependent Clp endopeptidase proteolytic subunit ClpP
MATSNKSKEEIAATVARLKAEANQANAEAALAEAQVRKEIANAKRIEIELRKLKIETEKAERCRKKELAVDEENFLYRFGSEVSSSSVSGCMKKLTEWHRLNSKCSMEIIFSSPGGSIIDGFELFDYIQHLRNEGHEVTTGSLGYAASMAGILLQSGGTRWIGHQAWLMIHRAAFGAYGKTFEVEDEVKFVKRIEERILDIFTSRSKLTRTKIKRNWERKDWWISADEALELGLVDEVRAMMPEHKGKGFKGKKKK